MAGYLTGDAAYAFELFECAPACEPGRREKSEPEKRREQLRPLPSRQPGQKHAAPKKAAPKTKQASVREVLREKSRGVQVVLLCLLLFVPICASINARRQLDELSRQMERQRAAIADEQSESVRLNAEVNSRMSISKIEDYASNVLGMVKLTPYSVTHYDFSGTDKVVLSGGKTLQGEEDVSIISKLLSYFK